MQHLRSARHRKLIEAIVEARKATGLSQRALAARLKRSPSYISKFEAGERRLEVCEFVDLCTAIHADPAEIVRGLKAR
jgi:transcriptional regulator with XRE-family HTH domain